MPLWREGENTGMSSQRKGGQSRKRRALLWKMHRLPRAPERQCRNKKYGLSLCRKTEDTSCALQTKRLAIKHMEGRKRAVPFLRVRLLSYFRKKIAQQFCTFSSSKNTADNFGLMAIWLVEQVDNAAAGARVRVFRAVIYVLDSGIDDSTRAHGGRVPA